MNKTFVPAAGAGEAVHFAVNGEKMVFVRGKCGFCYDFMDPPEMLFPFASFATKNKRVNFVSIRDTELTTNFCVMVGTDSEIYIVNQAKRVVNKVEIRDTSDVYTMKMPSYAAAWDPFERNIAFVSGDKSMLHHFVVFIEEGKKLAFKSSWDIYIGATPLQILYPNDAQAPIYELTIDWVLRLIRWDRMGGGPPVVTHTVSVGERASLAMNVFNMVFVGCDSNVMFVDPDMETVKPTIVASIEANARIESLVAHPSYPGFVFATTGDGNIVAVNIDDPSECDVPPYQWDIVNEEEVEVVPHGDDFVLILKNSRRFEFVEFFVGSSCKFEKKVKEPWIVECNGQDFAMAGDPFSSGPNDCVFLRDGPVPGELVLGTIDQGVFHPKKLFALDEGITIKQLYIGHRNCLFCLTTSGWLCQITDSGFARLFESLQDDRVIMVSIVEGRRGFALTESWRMISFNVSNPKDNCAMQLNRRQKITFIKGTYDRNANKCYAMIGVAGQGILFLDESLDDNPDLMSETSALYSYPYCDADMAYPTLVAIDKFPAIVCADRQEMNQACVKTILGLSAGKITVSNDQSYFVLQNSRVMKYSLPKVNQETNLGLDGATVAMVTAESVYFVSPTDGIGCHIMKEKTEARSCGQGHVATTKFSKKCVWDVRDRKTIMDRNALRLKLATMSAGTEREQAIVRMLCALLSVEAPDNGSQRLIVQSIHRTAQNQAASGGEIDNLSKLVLADQNKQYNDVIPELIKMGMLEYALGYFAVKSEDIGRLPICLAEAIVDRLWKSGDWLTAARLCCEFGTKVGYDAALKHLGIIDEEVRIGTTELTSPIEACLGLSQQLDSTEFQM